MCNVLQMLQRLAHTRCSSTPQRDLLGLAVQILLTRWLFTPPFSFLAHFFCIDPLRCSLPDVPARLLIAAALVVLWATKLACLDSPRPATALAGPWPRRSPSDLSSLVAIWCSAHRSCPLRHRLAVARLGFRCAARIRRGIALRSRLLWPTGRVRPVLAFRATCAACRMCRAAVLGALWCCPWLSHGRSRATPRFLRGPR
jgi:hypothetical protein